MPEKSVMKTAEEWAVTRNGLRIFDVSGFMTVIEPCRTPVHESVTRAYQILERVKILLNRGVPGDVVIDFVDEMERSLLPPTMEPKK